MHAQDVIHLQMALALCLGHAVPGRTVQLSLSAAESRRFVAHVARLTRAAVCQGSIEQTSNQEGPETRKDELVLKNATNLVQDKFFNLADIF